jgi:hypothetical protein
MTVVENCPKCGGTHFGSYTCPIVRTTMKLSELKAGDVLIADDGFTCLRAGPHTVEASENGLFIKCDVGRHFLTAQEDRETGELVGFSFDSHKPGQEPK